MHRYFITGTDTDVGKTMISAVLTLALKARYWKPVQSGVTADTTEQNTVKKLTLLSADYFFPSTYSLQAPLSPDQAAARENMIIDPDKIILPDSKNSLIVEGAGGVFVPLNKDYLMLDLMKKLNLPAIIVTRGTLGTINHTLLTIAVLRQWSIPIRGIVFNGVLNPENQLAIEHWGKVKTLFHVPQFENLTVEIFQQWVNNNMHLIQEVLDDEYITA